MEKLANMATTAETKLRIMQSILVNVLALLQQLNLNTDNIAA